MAIYLVYDWPAWLRNFVLNSDGRKVYAYANWDVDQISFCVQEFLIFGICWLLAVLWMQWLSLLPAANYNPPPHENAEDNRKVLEAAFDVERLDFLSSLFTHWQLASLVLAAGFLVFTSFYWNIVVMIEDERYLISALLAQLLWAISWTLITLPLLICWREWNHIRDVAIQHAALYPLPAGLDADKMLALLGEFQPVAWTNLTVSKIAAAVSFLLPLVQLILK